MADTIAEKFLHWFESEILFYSDIDENLLFLNGTRRYAFMNVNQVIWWVLKYSEQQALPLFLLNGRRNERCVVIYSESKKGVRQLKHIMLIKQDTLTQEITFLYRDKEVLSDLFIDYVINSSKLSSKSRFILPEV